MRFWGLNGILGDGWDTGHCNICDIGQCMKYKAIYEKKGTLWDIGQCMGYWAMYGMLGNVCDIGQWRGYLGCRTIHRIFGNICILGEVCIIGQCIFY